MAPIRLVDGQATTAAASVPLPPSLTMPCRSFVRVRPFTPDEAVVCPEGSTLPREVVVWDKHDTLTVLDAQNDFLPRKNGSFAFHLDTNDIDNNNNNNNDSKKQHKGEQHNSGVLWSFVDPDVHDVPVHAQADVYARVVAPVLPHIVAGYSAAFCVTGAPGTGRCYTLYGSSVDDAQSRGLLPRFVDDVFDAFERHKSEDSIMTAELEVVDIVGESYVDMLALRSVNSALPLLRNNNNSSNGGGAVYAADELVASPSGASTTLKLQGSDDGPRLQGLTTLELKGAADARAVLKQLQRSVTKRNHRSSTHTVRLRFTETFEFADPDGVNAPVRKSRRVQVLFVLLRSPPAALQRCIDVAVEHDSGENVLAKVPIRETALTRLYPDWLRQGFTLHFVSCVSPYYEHARDTTQTLQLAYKLRKLRGAPRLSEDESLLDMRRLADEVRHLKLAERKQNEAMLVVQREINAREVALMRQEARHREATEHVARARGEVRLASIGRNVEACKTRRARVDDERQLALRRREVDARRRDVSSRVEARQRVLRAIDESRVRAAANEARTTQQQAIVRACGERLRAQAEQRATLAVLESFAAASTEEQKARILAESTLHVAAAAELAQVRDAIAAARAADDASVRDVAALQPAYDAALAAEQPCRDADALRDELHRNEHETVTLTQRTHELQMQIDALKSQSSCSVM